MKRNRTVVIGVLLLTGLARAAEQPATEKIDTRLLALHWDEAKRWEIFLDEAQTKKAKFVPEPVYRWTNASRANGQSGAMFVWMFEGRPVALGGVFSNPEAGRRVIMHEFHALGSLRIFPRLKDSDLRWRPEVSVPLYPLADAPAPLATATQRTLQMRNLAREFTAHTVDDHNARWQLRLLSRPLYRYEMTGGDLIEGAIFAFVSDAGTDPEIILVLEAVKNGGKESWRYRTVRFSISSLYVQFKGKEVWTSPRAGPNGPFDNPGNTYGLIRDRLIDELPELSARRDKGL
jgi:hypothetical protein